MNAQSFQLKLQSTHFKEGDDRKVSTGGAPVFCRKKIIACLKASNFSLVTEDCRTDAGYSPLGQLVTRLGFTTQKRLMDEIGEALGDDEGAQYQGSEYCQSGTGSDFFLCDAYTFDYTFLNKIQDQDEVVSIYIKFSLSTAGTCEVLFFSIHESTVTAPRMLT